MEPGPLEKILFSAPVLILGVATVNTAIYAAMTSTPAKKIGLKTMEYLFNIGEIYQDIKEAYKESRKSNIGKIKTELTPWGYNPKIGQKTRTMLNSIGGNLN